MANWADSQVQLTTAYADLLTRLRDRDKDLACQFQVGTVTNLPEGALRYNVASGRMERREASSWVAQPVAIAGGGTGATTAAGARTALGATTVGSALFTAASAAAARTALQATSVGSALFTAASAAAARTALEATSVGSALFTAASASAARTALGGTTVGSALFTAVDAAAARAAVGLGTADVIRLGSGSASAPTYSFAAEPGTGLYRSGAGELALACSGVRQAWVTDNGTLRLRSRVAGSEGSPDHIVVLDNGTLLYSIGVPSGSVFAFRTGSSFGFYTGSIAAGPTRRLSVSASTVQADVPVLLPGDATNPLHAVPKQQLDAAIAGINVDVTGLPALAAGTQVRAAYDAAWSIAPEESWRSPGELFLIQSGAVRVTAEHRVLLAGTSELRVVRNGTVLQTWSTTSGAYQARSLDVSVSRGDRLVVEHRLVGGGGGGAASEARNMRIQTSGANIWPVTAGAWTWSFA